MRIDDDVRYGIELLIQTYHLFPYEEWARLQKLIIICETGSDHHTKKEVVCPILLLR